MKSWSIGNSAVAAACSQTKTAPHVAIPVKVIEGTVVDQFV